MDCHLILYRHSWCPEDESQWLWWWSTWPLVHTAGSKHSHMPWNVSTSTRWIGAKAYRHSCFPDDQLFWLFFSWPIVMLPFVVLGKKCRQQLDGLPWNLVQIFMSPWGWTVKAVYLVCVYGLYFITSSSIIYYFIVSFDWSVNHSCELLWISQWGINKVLSYLRWLLNILSGTSRSNLQ